MQAQKHSFKNIVEYMVFPSKMTKSLILRAQINLIFPKWEKEPWSSSQQSFCTLNIDTHPQRTPKPLEYT